MLLPSLVSMHIFLVVSQMHHPRQTYRLDVKEWVWSMEREKSKRDGQRQNGKEKRRKGVQTGAKDGWKDG